MYFNATIGRYACMFMRCAEVCGYFAMHARAYFEKVGPFEKLEEGATPPASS